MSDIQVVVPKSDLPRLVESFIASSTFKLAKPSTYASLLRLKLVEHAKREAARCCGSLSYEEIHLLESKSDGNGGYVITFENPLDRYSGAPTSTLVYEPSVPIWPMPSPLPAAPPPSSDAWLTGTTRAIRSGTFVGKSADLIIMDDPIT